MTPINLRLFCGPYYITCGNFATTCCAQRSPLDSSSTHVLGCRSPILTCFMTGFVLWPMKTLPSPRPQRSMKILAFSKTLSVYEDPCLLRDPIGLWRSRSRVKDPSHTWSFSPSARQPFLYYYSKIQPDRTSTDIPYSRLIDLLAYLSSFLSCLA